MTNEWLSIESEVADVFIRRRAQKSAGGAACYDCCRGCAHRTCLNHLYTGLVFSAFVGLGMLIAFGVMLVEPYRKSLHFEATRCSVSNVRSNTARVSCKCGKGCWGYFPCLQIYVNYRHSDGRSVTAMLHAKEYFGECTFTPPCKRDEDTNVHAVKQYEREWGRGNYPCLYNTEPGSTEVMRARQTSTHSLVHIILWPALMVVVGVGVVVCMCRTCGCEYVCDNKPPEDVQAAADSLLLSGVMSLEDRTDEEIDGLMPPTPRGDQVDSVVPATST